jgi:carbon storage regulator
MLVLSRKVNQRIRVGDDIEITVLAIDGDHVRLGIVAPRSVPIMRTELLHEVRAENLQAVATTRLAPALRALIGRTVPGGSGDLREPVAIRR